jgi:hypothetical protein
MAQTPIDRDDGDQGQEVDVDLVDDAEAFDVWRARWFLDHGATSGPSLEGLDAGCAHLASLNKLQEARAGRW